MFWRRAAVRPSDSCREIPIGPATSRSGTRAATEESVNLSACRRQPARGDQAGTPRDRPTGAAHGRNRAHSPRRLARVEPAREFAAAGARVRAGRDRESAAVAAPLAPATAVLCGPVCRRFHERRAGRQRTPRFAPPSRNRRHGAGVAHERVAQGARCGTAHVHRNSRGSRARWPALAINSSSPRSADLQNGANSGGYARGGVLVPFVRFAGAAR